MKIEHGKTITTIRFDDVPCGECFYYDGELFMKINTKQAFNFETDSITNFDEYDRVEWVKTKLIVG